MATKRSTEDRLIETLFARHGADSESVLIGPGDDAAMVRPRADEELLITTDTLNVDVHFPAGTPAHAIGYRALAVSISDLAAMAARPLWALVSLSVPSAEESWLTRFADGLYCAADRFKVRVIGGDFVRGPISVTVTAHGAAKRAAALRRSGARAGHGIWVSGYLGDAAAGLKMLQQASSSSPDAQETLIQRFCYPQPRVELGSKLAGIASACMDLSDGLLLDLPRLMRASGLGARVEMERLPISKELKNIAGTREARQLALTGGDDYELCFTLAPERESRLGPLSAELPVTRIGGLHAGQDLEFTLGGAPWQPAGAGFAHFS